MCDYPYGNPNFLTCGNFNMPHIFQLQKTLPFSIIRGWGGVVRDYVNWNLKCEWNLYICGNFCLPQICRQKLIIRVGGGGCQHTSYGNFRSTRLFSIDVIPSSVRCIILTFHFLFELWMTYVEAYTFDLRLPDHWLAHRLVAEGS